MNYPSGKRKFINGVCFDESNGSVTVTETYTNFGKSLTLDEAIIHCEEVAEINQAIADNTDDDNWMDIAQCEKCAAEHNQLAGWLKELKRYREKNFKSYGYAEYDSDYPHK